MKAEKWKKITATNVQRGALGNENGGAIDFKERSTKQIKNNH